MKSCNIISMKVSRCMKQWLYEEEYGVFPIEKKEKTTRDQRGKWGGCMGWKEGRKRKKKKEEKEISKFAL